MVEKIFYGREMMRKELSRKERLFCDYYSKTRSSREAAFKAGYRILPERAAEKLMSRKDIREMISQLDEMRKAKTADISAGLRRAAFGSIADAIRLMFDENLNPEELDGLDLFCVSEIKRPKGGGMEIKFIDRLKALEKLQSLAETEREADKNPFVEAIEKSAKAVFSGE